MNGDADIAAAAAGRLFEDLATVAAINDAEAGIWPEALWRAVEETGLTLALVPEDSGGAGSAAVAAAILHAAGYHAAPVPIAETILAGWALSAAGIAVPPGPLAVAPVNRGDSVTVDASGIAGTARRVPWGRDARHIVVVGDGVVALTKADSARIEPGCSLAGEPRDTVAFAGDAVACAAAPLDRTAAFKLGALLRSVQMAGAVERGLALCIAYASERRQFGRPIAKFQAIQHRLAELAGHAAAACAAADAAVAAWERGDDAFAIAAAKVRCGEAAGAAAAIAHQVHGAIGFTYEHRLHHFTRRLWSWRDEFGNEAVWAARLGEQVAEAGGDGLWPLITAS